MPGESVRSNLFGGSPRVVLPVGFAPIPEDDVGEFVRQTASLTHRVRRRCDRDEDGSGLGVPHGHPMFVIIGVDDCDIVANGLLNERDDIAERLRPQLVLLAELFRGFLGFPFVRHRYPALRATAPGFGIA